MANQYFENNPDLKSEIKSFNYYFKGFNLVLFSDNGVFSKSGVDFGSNLLLKNIQKDDYKNILDVGCGYGTIGITIAKMFPNSFVTMVDVNLRALELTKKAMEENDIRNSECFESSTYDHVTKLYDLIVSNPPIRAGKSVVHDIILNAYDHLKDDGKMYCVIQKKQGAPSAYDALKEKYKLVEIVDKDNGYWIIRATK